MNRVFRISRETFEGGMDSTDVEGTEITTTETDHGTTIVVFDISDEPVHEIHVPAHAAYEWEEIDPEAADSSGGEN